MEAGEGASGRPTDDRAAAQAAVLGRLWGALCREPIPGVRRHHLAGAAVVLELADGRTVRGDAAAAVPFARPSAGLSVSVGEAAYTDPATLLRALGLAAVGVERMAAELDNCVANLAMARGAQPRPDGGPSTLQRALSQPDPLAFVEQCVVDGHPLHPCCRTRMGLSPAEVLAYAPEHHPVVGLTPMRVPPDRWLATNAPPVLLVHPWQRDHVLDRYRWLTPAGPDVLARPLLSLRTLALVGNPGQHIKTAVDVQMTSAIRTVSPAAVHNGPILTALLQRLAVPGLTVLPEVAGGLVLVDGEPCRSLAMLRRELPPLAPGEIALPLAAFAAPSPADGRPILAECVAAVGDPLVFLGALASVVLRPLLTLLGLGIALEAHGQNVLVVLRDGRPTRLLYRDFGGVRVSPARLGERWTGPPLKGDITSDDPAELRTKLFAAVMASGLCEVIAVMTRAEAGAGYPSDVVTEEAAWGRLATVIRSWELPAAGSGDVARLLVDPIPVKAMTAMRLAAEPLEEIWTFLPNPMGAM